jgi:hypothetical protein
VDKLLVEGYTCCKKKRSELTVEEEEMKQWERRCMREEEMTQNHFLAAGPSIKIVL